MGTKALAVAEGPSGEAVKWRLGWAWLRRSASEFVPGVIDFKVFLDRDNMTNSAF